MFWKKADLDDANDHDDEYASPKGIQQRRLRISGTDSLYFSRDRFINSNFSFVMKTATDYMGSLSDPDSGILWSDVVLVISRSRGKILCPICLSEILTVPRVSWCGHILCYPCAIDYFESHGSATKLCPICQEIIYIQEMKPVSISNFPPSVAGPTPDAPQKIKMVLVKKTKGSCIALPVGSHNRWIRDTMGRAFPLASDYDTLRFARIMSEPYPGYYLDLLQDDLNELLSIVPVLDGVPDADGELSVAQTPSSTIEKSISYLISQISSISGATPATPRLPTSRLPLSKINTILSSAPNDDPQSVGEDVCDTALLFYQCATGEPLFLRSLDSSVIRALHEQNSEPLPPLLSLLVYNVTTLTFDGSCRGRYRYLSHLSSCSEVGLCDTELVYPPYEDILPEQLMKKLRIRRLQLTASTTPATPSLDGKRAPPDIASSPDSYTEYSIPPCYDLEPPPPLDMLHEWPEIGSTSNKHPHPASIPPPTTQAAGSTYTKTAESFASIAAARATTESSAPPSERSGPVQGLPPPGE